MICLDLPSLPGRPAALSRAIDKVLAHADCQSAIQPIDNRRYGVAQTGSLLYRRLLTGYGCATICANFVNGPAALTAASESVFTFLRTQPTLAATTQGDQL
ncbi:MAG: hypothetical protein DME24_18215 [Verrucomicrobia bacterium]|nr:MAG: hypothetical protein DME24_18215 [Verrucomicrobiota bacterium]